MKYEITMRAEGDESAISALAEGLMAKATGLGHTVEFCVSNVDEGGQVVHCDRVQQEIEAQKAAQVQ